VERGCLRIAAHRRCAATGLTVALGAYYRRCVTAIPVWSEVEGSRSAGSERWDVSTASEPAAGPPSRFAVEEALDRLLAEVARAGNPPSTTPNADPLSVDVAALHAYYDVTGVSRLAAAPAWARRLIDRTRPLLERLLAPLLRQLTYNAANTRVVVRLIDEGRELRTEVAALRAVVHDMEHHQARQARALQRAFAMEVAAISRARATRGDGEPAEPTDSTAASGRARG
jgi:hypothetical protein